MIKIVWSINDINKYQTGSLLDDAVKIETPQSVGDLMKKAVPDEYAEWMTDDIVDYMFDLDSDYKITIKVTDKEKIAKKDLEETLIDDYYVLDSIAEDAKAGYILEAEATLKQDGEKDTQDITLVVVKVDGKWVIVSGL
mgnify:CR=1 FL=1